MPPIGSFRSLRWTSHAKAKMNHYGLSPARIRRVIHSPKRIEEGIAPKTIAMMQPASVKTSGGRAGAAKKETWSQEIWVMFQDSPKERTVISAWRYPGVTKPRSEVAAAFLHKEYKEFLAKS